MDWIVTWSIVYSNSESALFRIDRSDDHWLDACNNVKLELTELSENGFEIFSVQMDTLF